MSVAAMEQDLYERFEPKQDSLFFRIGSQGIISFHGRNCNIRKRISAEQRKNLMSDAAFFQVSSDCYVNVNRITAIERDCVYFEEKTYGVNRIPVSRGMREKIMQRLEERRQ